MGWIEATHETDLEQHTRSLDAFENTLGFGHGERQRLFAEDWLFGARHGQYSVGVRTGWCRHNDGIQSRLLERNANVGVAVLDAKTPLHPLADFWIGIDHACQVRPSAERRDGLGVEAAHAAEPHDGNAHGGSAYQIQAARLSRDSKSMCRSRRCSASSNRPSSSERDAFLRGHPNT